MNWETLRLFALRAPEPTGLAIALPLLQTPDGRVFQLRDIWEEDPTPNVYLDPSEAENVERIGFVRVPKRPAALGFLGVAASRSFVMALEKSARNEPSDFEALDGGIFIRYDSVENIRHWRANAATALLRFTQGQLPGVLQSRDSRMVSQIESVLMQVRFVTDRGDDQRKDMYVSTGILLVSLGVDRWTAIRSLAARELGIAEEILDDNVQTRIAELRTTDDPPVIEFRAFGIESRRPIAHLSAALAQ